MNPVRPVPREVHRIEEPRSAERGWPASQGGLAHVLDAARVGIWELAPRSGAMTADDRTLALFGLERVRNLTCERLFVHVHEEDAPGLHAAMKEAADCGGPLDEVFRVSSEGGNEDRWLAMRGTTLAEPGGKQKRLSGIVFDITAIKATDEALRRNEERQRLLLSELDHRVKNMLANIGAIANRTGRRATSVPEFTRSLEDRIHAMATAHSLLSANRWRGADFGTLVEGVLAPFTSCLEKVEIKGERLLLKPKTTQSMALALHELATNAARHGALSMPEGHVQIAWLVAKEGPDRVTVVWRETGGPALDVSPEKGFGLTVLQDMIAHDLDAHVTCAFPKEGAVCTIAFPATLVECPSEASAPDAQAGLPETDGVPEDPRAPAAVTRSHRIFVVEDSWVIGLQAKTMLEAMGHEVIGPATTLDEALGLAGEEIDCAILDISLEEADVFPVAEKLEQRHIPFGFASGYTEADGVPPRFRQVPRIAKPYSDRSIGDLVGRLLHQPTGSSAD